MTAQYGVLSVGVIEEIAELYRAVEVVIVQPAIDMI